MSRIRELSAPEMEPKGTRLALGKAGYMEVRTVYFILFAMTIVMMAMAHYLILRAV